MLMSSTFNVCEICGELRNKRVHSKCSRILQRRYNKVEWELLLKQVRRDELAQSMQKDLSVRVNGGKHK